MKIILLDEAQRQFELEDAWWRENRDAKELFTEEFRGALLRIGEMPELGQRYRRARGRLIQRVQMKKSRCHVYYSRL